MTTQHLFDSIKRQHDEVQPLPSKHKAQQFIDRLIDGLFPVRQADLIDELGLKQLELGLWELLQPLKRDIRPVEEIIAHFFGQLPHVYNTLCEDARSVLEFDPAAESIEEIVLAYPGFYATAVYRLSHILYDSKVPILPRIISEYAHSQTGIDIHPGATIGQHFFIDHGTGVVIGETAIIGDDVKIYQGVTLGALNVRKEDCDKKRHPTIENNVTIYSGSTILGGKTVVGHDTIIGGNVWLTESVLPFSLVYHKSEIKIRTNKDFEEPINFVI